MTTLDLDQFYFIRHGQTDANLQRLMCGGQWDVSLNATGVAQIEAAAETLSRSVRAFSAICASPLLRARQSAEIIARKFDVPVIYCDELREWDIGNWDRKPFEEVKEAFLGSGEPEGGESRAQLRERVHRGLRRIQEFGGSSLIVSHGAVWMTVQQILQVETAKVENGIPHKVFREETRWRAERLDIS